MNARTRLSTLMRPRARNDWYKIVNTSADTAELWILDEIGYWGTTAASVVEQLRQITAPRITVRINSPGGDVDDGLTIYHCLREHPAHVTTQVVGLAASAASFIALAGDTVVTGRNALWMIHDAAGLCFGQADDMRHTADVLDKVSANIADIYARKGGGTVDEWRALMRAETWYTGAEALAAGLADEMTDPDAAPDDGLTNTWDLSIFRYAGREAAPAPAPVGGRGQAPPEDRAGVEPLSPPAAGPNVATIVGERGPELVKLPDGGCIVPPGTLTIGAAGGPTSTITVTMPDGVDLGAALVDALRGDPVDTACPSHHTATVEGTWDAGTQEGKLPSPMSLATARKMYAIYDQDQVDGGEIIKGACHLPHHEVSADGTPGAANMTGVSAALGRLDQVKGASAEEKAAARRHLEAHQADAPGGDDSTDQLDTPAAGEDGDEWAAEVAGLLDEPAADTDEWATAVAGLVDTDPWAATVAGLTDPSAVDDQLARLREAV